MNPNTFEMLKLALQQKRLDAQARQIATEIENDDSPPSREYTIEELREELGLSRG